MPIAEMNYREKYLSQIMSPSHNPQLQEPGHVDIAKSESYPNKLSFEKKIKKIPKQKLKAILAKIKKTGAAAKI